MEIRCDCFWISRDQHADSKRSTKLVTTSANEVYSAFTKVDFLLTHSGGAVGEFYVISGKFVSQIIDFTGFVVGVEKYPPIQLGVSPAVKNTFGNA